MFLENANIFTLAEMGDIDTFKNKFDDDLLNTTSDDGHFGLLHKSIAGRNEDVVLFLLSEGVDVNIQDYKGFTALQYVCDSQASDYNFSLRIAKLILDSGFNIDMKDKYGNGVIWTATFNCRDGWYELVELIMTYKPDVLTKNKYGRSPLDMALTWNDERLIAILSKGSDSK